MHGVRGTLVQEAKLPPSDTYEQDWDGDFSGTGFVVKSLVGAAYLPPLGKALPQKVLEVLIHTCIRYFRQMSSTKTCCSPGFLYPCESLVQPRFQSMPWIWKIWPPSRCNIWLTETNEERLRQEPWTSSHPHPGWATLIFISASWVSL